MQHVQGSWHGVGDVGQLYGLPRAGWPALRIASVS